MSFPINRYIYTDDENVVHISCEPSQNFNSAAVSGHTLDELQALASRLQEQGVEVVMEDK